MRITSHIRIIDSATPALRLLKGRAQNLSPLMATIGVLGVRDIMHNFQTESYPGFGGGTGRQKWKGLKRPRRRGGRNRFHPILQDTSVLKKSVNFSTLEDGRSVRIAPDSNLEYGAIHNFGFRGFMAVPAHTRTNPATGKSHAVKAHRRAVYLPARPYLRLSGEMLRKVIAKTDEFISGAVSNRGSGVAGK